MSPDTFSLLYPQLGGESRHFEHLSSDCLEDLHLGDLAGRLAWDGISRSEALDILSTLCTDLPTIEYRQAIISDLVAAPLLASQLKSILPKVSEMTWYSDTHRDQSNPFLQAIWRLGELELYVDCLESFHEVFDRWNASVRSQGLQDLCSVVEARRSGDDFKSLQRELPKLKAALQSRKSVTLGINLDDRLRPVEAVLLSVNDKSFREQSLVSRLFGRDAAGTGFDSALPLHSTPRPATGNLYPTGAYPLSPLFQDLEKLLHSLSRPLTKQVRNYVGVNTRIFDSVRRELAFFVGAAELLLKMREQGLPLCRPSLLPMQQRELHAAAFYNLHLAFRIADDPDRVARKEIVTNDLEIGQKGRILILTGPNQGGKTTYAQGVGLLQVLAQSGLLVPAESAIVSPVDRIITHFPIRDTGALEQGRLAEEASRLSRLFATASRGSLVLLNESLSSTSPGESVYLAEDIVSALRLVGLRAIFATHLHALANRVEEINASVEGDSALVSLVAGVVDSGGEQRADGTARRTFKITMGPPIGKSYAKDIAERYGISLDRIRDALKKRGVIE